MSSRANLHLVIGLALVVGLLLAIDLRHRGAHSETDESASAIDAAKLVVFDGGYAVGPAYLVNKHIQESIRGTNTACEEPAPTRAERADWKPLRGPLSATSLTALMALDDDSLAGEVESRLLDKVYGPGFASMTPEEQNVFLAYELDGEVENGGLDQYFTNSAGNCALRALAALDAIGGTESADRLRRAIALFPDGGPSEDRSTRFDQLDALGRRRAVFDHLDAKWEPSTAHVAAYVRAHARAFHLPNLSGAP